MVGPLHKKLNWFHGREKYYYSRVAGAAALSVVSLGRATGGGGG